MGFEWDEPKRLANLREHGIDFADAALIFDGPVAEARDDREDYGDVLLRALGEVGGQFYIVAYTWRGPNRRIISAWRVDDNGTRRYSAILAR